MKRLVMLLMLLVVPLATRGQAIVTPTTGNVTIDVSTCGQAAGTAGPTCSFALTMTGNVTLSIINATNGRSFNFFINPSTFTLTWPSNVTTPPTPAASATTLLSLQYNGAAGSWFVSSGGSSGGGVPITTVAGLATVSGKTKGTIAVVTDGNSASDCTTGGASTVVVCQYSGSTWAQMAAASSGSTAFSALTAGTNSNSGTFGASANTWDFSAVTLFKQRFSAGLTSSTNGDFGYDTTANRWHFWQNGADKFVVAASNVGASGQPCLSNADGSCTFADPIVSGPDAVGVAPTKNPVQIGCLFLTTPGTLTNNQVGEAQCDSTQHLLVNVNNTPSVSVANTPNVTIQSNASVNLNQVAGAALGATGVANFGTAPAAAAVPGINSSLFIGTAPPDTNTGNASGQTQRVVVATNQPAIPVSGDTNGCDGSIGSAVPTKGCYQAGQSSSNLLGYVNCDQLPANNAGYYDASTNGTTKVIANSAGKHIVICGGLISTSQTTLVHAKLEYGTKTTNDCDTGTTQFTPNWPLQAVASSGPIGFQIPATITRALEIPASKDVCIVTDAAASLQALLYFTYTSD